jgi:hypothetical protein
MALKLANLQYNINIIFSIIAVGFIVLFIDIKAAIVGYGIMAFCVIGVIFLLFALLSQGQLKQSVFTLIYNILYNSTPTIAVLLILTWLIAMNIINYDKITSDAVPDDFLTFLNIANILLIVQFVCLKYYIGDQITITKHTLEGNTAASKMGQIASSNTTMALYLFSTMNFIVLGICQVIIKYYTTDG